MSLSYLCRITYSYISKSSRCHISKQTVSYFCTRHESDDIFVDNDCNQQMLQQQSNHHISDTQKAGKLEDHRNEIEFIGHRISVFDAIYKRQCAERDALPDEPSK